MKTFNYALALLVLLCCWNASARIWEVRLDGTGDYVDVQEAVDACAVGDTILLGPGRYDVFHPYDPGDSPGLFKAIIGIDVDSLTIRGMSKDDVIIGPSDASVFREDMIGIMMSLSTTWLDIENVTIENLPTRGVYFYLSGRIADSIVTNCTNTGVIFDRGVHGIVERCEFVNSLLYTTRSGGDKLLVHDSSFIGSAAGVHVSGHPDVAVSSCTFTDCRVSVAAYGLSHISVDSCTISGGWFGVIAEEGYGDGSVHLTNNMISGQRYNAIKISNMIMTGSNNYLHSAGTHAIAGSNYRAAFYGNHIIKGSVGLIILYFYNIPDLGLDYTGNWWGTADPDSIAAWIHDGNDDPSIQAQIQYEPFADHPLPAEQKSFSDLKRMFR